MTPLDSLSPTRTRWQYEAGLRLEPHPKIKAWLASEREKVEYISASSMGPLALTKLLSNAITANDLSRLALLLARCPAHALDGGMYPRQPPLHMAAACGQIDCLALLLGRSASVSTLDADGRTALIVAVESGYSACACELLSHGADADAMCANGQPLLHKAALRGMGTCVSAILQRGGTISATDLHGRNAFHAGICMPWPLWSRHLFTPPSLGHSPTPSSPLPRALLIFLTRAIFVFSPIDRSLSPSYTHSSHPPTTTYPHPHLPDPRITVIGMASCLNTSSLLLRMPMIFRICLPFLLRDVTIV